MDIIERKLYNITSSEKALLPSFMSEYDLIHITKDDLKNLTCSEKCEELDCNYLKKGGCECCELGHYHQMNILLSNFIKYY